MEKPYILVLKDLEEEGIGVYKNISPLLMNLFPLVDTTDLALYQKHVNEIRVLLNSLNDQINLEIGKADHIVWGRRTEQQGWIPEWLDTVPIKAYITSNGLSHLNSIRSQHLTYAVSQSMISTNKSVTATNESVKEVNRITTSLNKRQNKLIYITLIIAILSVLFPALSYFHDNRVTHLNNTVNIQREALELAQAKVRRLQASYDSLYKVVRTIEQQRKK